MKNERPWVTKSVLFSMIVAGLIIGMAVTFQSCATSQLPKDATPAEKRAAMCTDATASMAMANAALSGKKGPLDVETKRWWAAFQRSAEIGVATYCIQQ